MTKNELEQQFRLLTRQLLENYQSVENVVRMIDRKQPASLDVEQLTHINELMKPVKQTESALGPIRESMQSMGISTPDDVKPLIDKTLEIVGYLLPRIGELESAARESRQKLAPSIGASVRAMKMQSAYGRGK